METDIFLDNMDFLEPKANWELDFLHQDPDPMQQYINQMLLEEESSKEVEPLALQNTEKSVYDALIDVDESSLGRNSVVLSETNDAVSMFNRGIEEGRKFLPSIRQLNTHTLSERGELRSRKFLPSVSQLNINTLSERGQLRSPNRKHRHEDDDNDDEERRNSKQSTAGFSAEEDELSEKFDRVLLNHAPPDDLKFGETAESKTYSGPDLSALLMSYAQSIDFNHQSTANETLKLIKKHASPTGDPVQILEVLGKI